MWILKDLLILALGVFLGWMGNYYFYRKGEEASAVREEENIARYVVLSMALRYPLKDSRDLDSRVKSYLDALRKTKADKRGVPVYRDDGSIGVDWSLSFEESVTLQESLSRSK